MTIRHLATALVCQLVLVVSAGAAEHCVRSDAPAGGDGSDWAKAWTQLPASLVRGDTYHIADGSYPAYTFDDPVSGEEYITVKKATASDHGSEQGWNAEYGDGQAVFAYGLRFKLSYCVFDGMVGTGKVIGSYGFKVDKPIDRNLEVVGGQCQVEIGGRPGYSNVRVSHVEVESSGKEFNVTQIALRVGYAHDVTLSHCFVRNAQVCIASSYSYNLTIEYNYLKDQWSSSQHHGASTNFSDTRDCVFRYNVIENSSGTGAAIWYPMPAQYRFVNVGTPVSNLRWKVYGNVFLNCHGGNGVIGNGGSSHEDVMVDFDIHHNTMVGGGSIYTGGTPGPGCKAYNNLWYNGPAIISGVPEHDYNIALDCQSTATIESEPHGVIGVGNPFVNLAGENFRLARPTAAGIKVLDAPYDKDPDGQTRGADGVVDRGAYEYVAGIIATGGWQVVARHGQVDLATPMADGYVEPRSRGLRRFRVGFTAALDPATVSKAVVTIVGDTSGDQAALIDTVVLEGDRTLSVTLTAPLPDADRYTVAISPALHLADGQPVSGDLDLRLATLVGDVDSSGAVGAADILAVRDRANQPLNATTARYDVNHSGAITSNDMKTVRERDGRQLLP